MKPEEKHAAIFGSARALMKQCKTENGDGITLDQALRIIEAGEIWRIASNLYGISNTLDEIRTDISEDVSVSLDLTHKRLNEIEQTLFDTLGSAKTGAALDAIVAWGGGSPE